MIVAKRKPFEEIMGLIQDYKKVLTVGCGTCVAVCLAGGEKEVDVLNAELDMARRLKDTPIELGAKTVERQCDREYLAELDDLVQVEDAGEHWFRYRTPSPETTNPALLARLAVMNAQVLTLSEVPHSLEEVYLSIVESEDTDGR